ncbi:type II secretion system protein [Robertmurraya massiliosenegalensis]|uniref:type II secretion system protein n=1 Tax=Robertmurraya massiliosenegalensis TaxID=1287657 RepID=UPI0002FBD242|nr:prepilin-type N-terminal cleavage/methylation domain-containing protein [Robertmurraya massiliosenegalensis]
MMKNVKKRLKNERGLTLIELLAVIVILGIIAAIAIPSVNGIINKSKEDAIKTEAKAIVNAAKLYVVDNDLASTSSVTLTEDASGPNLIEYLDTNAEYSITITNTSGTFSYTDISVTKDGISRDYENESAINN